MNRWSISLSKYLLRRNAWASGSRWLARSGRWSIRGILRGDHRSSQWVFWADASHLDLCRHRLCQGRKKLESKDLIKHYKRSFWSDLLTHWHLTNDRNGVHENRLCCKVIVLTTGEVGLLLAVLVLSVVGGVPVVHDMFLLKLIPLNFEFIAANILCDFNRYIFW